MRIAQITGKFFQAPVMNFRLREIPAALYAECAAQKTSFFLWFPIFVSFGIGGYFSLPVEPPLVFGIFAFLVSVVWLVASWSRFRVPAILAILVTAGFLSAQVRTHVVHTPILQKKLGPVMVTGTIDAIEDLGDEAGARPFLLSWHRQSGVLRRAALYFAGVCMTTIIATIVTAPFALFHFNQLAVYSLIANVIAMPVLAFIVMPSVVVALFLMPFGLEVLAFYPMDIGVQGILEAAHFVAGLPHAVFKAPVWPLTGLVGLVLGILVLTLWRGHLRFLSVIGFAVFIISIIVYKQPDILISSSYNLVSFKADDGSFHISNTRKEKFVSENWARAYGLAPEDRLKWPKEGADEHMTCGEHGCRFTLKGYDVSYISQPMVGAEECADVDILLSREPLKGCSSPARVIDFFDTYYGGAHAIWLDEAGPVIRMSEKMRGNRPWSGLNKEF